jgi:hypothetical protein
MEIWGQFSHPVSKMDVVLEYIKQPELKYLRALGCAYLRITARRGSDGDADIPGS